MGGGIPCKSEGNDRRNLKGLNYRGLVSQKVFESPTFTFRVILIAFRVLSQKNMMTGTTVPKELAPFRGKTKCEPHPRRSFHNLRGSPPSVLHGSLLPSGNPAIRDSKNRRLEDVLLIGR